MKISDVGCILALAAATAGENATATMHDPLTLLLSISPPGAACVLHASSYVSVCIAFPRPPQQHSINKQATSRPLLLRGVCGALFGGSSASFRFGS